MCNHKPHPPVAMVTGIAACKGMLIRSTGIPNPQRIPKVKLNKPKSKKEPNGSDQTMALYHNAKNKYKF